MKNYACKIIVRQNTVTGKTLGGLASSLPRKSREWRDIAAFGSWFGCQMGYRPFAAAMAKARDLAGYCSDIAKGTP